MCEGSLFSTSLPTFFISCLLDSGHSAWCWMISQYGFDLHFPDNEGCGVSFHMPIAYLSDFFGKMSIHVLCPFFNCIIRGFLVLSCMNSLYILDIRFLLDIWFASIFSHSGDCLFILLLPFDVQIQFFKAQIWRTWSIHEFSWLTDKQNIFSLQKTDFSKAFANIS